MSELERVFISKADYTIKFVPWVVSETGLMVMAKVNKGIPGKEFATDMAEAQLARYDVVFPNDSKPLRSKVDVQRELDRLAGIFRRCVVCGKAMTWEESQTGQGSTCSEECFYKWINGK